MPRVRQLMEEVAGKSKVGLGVRIIQVLKEYVNAQPTNQAIRPFVYTTAKKLADPFWVCIISSPPHPHPPSALLC
jgi:hypothetical protein